MPKKRWKDLPKRTKIIAQNYGISCVNKSRMGANHPDSYAETEADFKKDEQALIDLLSSSEVAANLFRKLREAWFNHCVALKAHEREWESEEAEQIRLENNRDTKEEYDRQTEALLSGEEKYLINPVCSYDIDKNKT